MSDFHELIKSFPKTRDYVRDFFVYGFKTRNDFKEKSPRTYDNERRRLESWLAPYVRKDYAPGGSSISLAIDSSLLDTNPLFRVWKTKSFTDNDIVLHFLILDLLQDGRPRTLEEITDSLLTQYEALFDIQTVRRKCNAYEKEGLLVKTKSGKTVLFSLDNSLARWLGSNRQVLDACSFFQMAGHFGIIGNELSQQFDHENRSFRVKHSFFVHPLEKSYLKALLSDPRMGLFLEPEQLKDLRHMLSAVPPLWRPEQFYYYDRFSDGDPYQDERYRHCFRILLQAQKNRQYVDIDYISPNGNRLHHQYVPARLEYSVKNDKFRLLALNPGKNGRMKLELLNLSRIQSARPVEKILSSCMDLNTLIRNSYYKEPVTLHIVNRRNALERAMLHFANYEKNTTKIDEDTYECLIYYNQRMETELLIEVLSFGPMLTVIGNKRFLRSLKARLRRQRALSLPVISS